MFKLQVCHQYIHSKSWLLWALSALLAETYCSGLGTEMSVYYQIFRSSSDLPASLSYEDFPDTKYWHHLLVLTWVSCSAWTCSRLATAMSGTTKHATSPSCAANKRSESIPEITGTQVRVQTVVFKQSVLAKLEKQEGILPPTNLTFSSNINSRKHLIRKDSSCHSPGLHGAFSEAELCKVCKLEQISRIPAHYSCDFPPPPCFLRHLWNKKQI